MLLKKGKSPQLPLENLENMLPLIIRSFGEHRKKFLENIPLIKKIQEKEHTYEFSVILDYIKVFGKERYLFILNNPRTYQTFLDIDDHKGILQPVVCNGIKHNFFEARVEAFSDFHHHNDTFEIRLEREPHNKYDSNAIKVLAGSRTEKHIGYIPANLAEKIAPLLDKGYSSVVFSDLEDYIDDDPSCPIKFNLSILKHK